MSVADNIRTKHMPTTCTSALLQGKHKFLTVLVLVVADYASDFTSPFDVTVVQLLNDAGATIIRKTNCDEFGMGYACTRFVGHLTFRSLNIHSAHGPDVNASILTNTQRALYCAVGCA